MAGNDADNCKPEGELTKLVVEKYGSKGGSLEFPKQKHGWVIKGDPKDEQVIKDIQTVFTKTH